MGYTCITPKLKGFSIDAWFAASIPIEIHWRVCRGSIIASAHLWTDAIIDPLETRLWVAMGIEAANHAPIEKPFNLGVIQV